ncbi:MAG: toll/interleukin-1 receptor domain-containing protein [Armatimonadota bacterium]|nr:toll/interleukin-1 receptor domain-containing protein [Armatimonadota bacterium]
MERTKVFVSYSHRDRDWLNRLLDHLAVLQRQGLIHVWSDTRIEIGADWEKEINSALDESTVAVLLVSPAFLASTYIWEKDKEMDRIMKHHEQGMAVWPLIVRPCAWRVAEDLAKFQARPAEGRALSTGCDAQVDLDLADFVYELAARVGKLSRQELEVAEQYRASPDQRPMRDSNSQQDAEQSDVEVNGTELGNLLDEILSRLPRSWTGLYSNGLTLRLTICNRQGRDFQGTIEYVGEETVTWVEGHFEEDVQKIVADFRRDAKINIREEQLALIFKEVDYKQKGRYKPELDGEYRALVADGSLSSSVLYGGWYSANAGFQGHFVLELED